MNATKILWGQVLLVSITSMDRTPWVRHKYVDSIHVPEMPAPSQYVQAL
jgi:hypothetical protein